ncbi:putative sulfate/molybdate transporter [Modicisalibacter tunisiensis]|uniref:putative sulfate/molybdate transporter n=1 Tax=Modicisalibacter tunisiensis TaxID=390637 RepID=UPI000795B615|nr:putative sulfate/molybdate transporter [Modicisalibacter tunisiensis]KXS39718.1 MAG: benzoate membrane transport protein [Halomonadaceae bacterium T82-2]MBZ9539184.1 putative sulfate/molybdate transporter [Modicisalibacter tunisiensis]
MAALPPVRRSAETSAAGTPAAGFAFNGQEINGALGDLGTLLPLTLGILALGVLPPGPVLFGFAAFYLATACCYRLPLPVQPMKAVAAMLLATGMTAQAVALSGVMIGGVMLMLGLTGWINRLSRPIPQSVLAGLQLGLGVMLARASLALMAEAPWLGGVTLAVLLVSMRRPRCPSVLITLLVAVGLGLMQGGDSPIAMPDSHPLLALAAWPDLGTIEHSLTTLVLPQLSLTVTNAVVLTALVAGDYFGERAAHVTPARLSITTGLANLVLAPFGALPMCHGAGGLAAHYRFGARTGTAPLLLGLALLVMACLPAQWGLAMLAAIPAAGLGALLLVAAWQLAVTRRLFDSRPDCWPVIAATAAVTVAVNPFWGLVAGAAAEWGRVRWTRYRRARDASAR